MNPWLWLLLLGFTLGIILAVWFTSKFRRLKGRRYHQRGDRAERRAQKVLKQQGYRIIEQNPRFTNYLDVNNQTSSFEITPDFLVEKDQQFYLVEVKHHTQSKSINDAKIRRQIIEYLICSELPCLLVTMPEGRIDLIELPEDNDEMTTN